MDPLWEVTKNSKEVIRFQVEEYRGQKFGDIRVYYDADGEWKPSRQGVVIRPAIWREFMKGVERVDAEMKTQGLLEESKGEGEPPSTPPQSS